MPIFKRTAYGIMIAVIAAYTISIAGASALIVGNYLNGLGETLSSSLQWTSAVAAPGPGNVSEEYLVNQSGSVIGKLIKDVTRVLSRTYVDRAVAFQAFRPAAGNGSMIGGSECVYLAQGIGEISLLIEVGINLSSGYAFWSPYLSNIPASDAELLQEVTGLPALQASPELSEFLSLVDRHLRQYEVGGYTYDTLLPYTKYYLVIDPSTGLRALKTAVIHLSRAGRKCGFSLQYLSSWRQVVLRVRPDTFLTSSPRNSLQELDKITDSLRTELGYEIYTVEPASSILKGWENAGNQLIAEGFYVMLPPIVALAVSAPLTSDLTASALKERVRLLRLRGASRRKVLSWMLVDGLTVYALTAIGTITGFLIYIFALGEYKIGLEAVEASLPTSLALTLGFWYLTFEGLWREGNRYGKVGAWGWLSLILGLYFLADAIYLPYIHWLAEGEGAASVLASIAEVLDRYLGPYAPLFLAYGIGRVLTSYTLDLLNSVGSRLSGGVKYLARALTSTASRTSLPAFFLMLVTITLTVSSSIAATSINGSLNASIHGSVGGEVLGMKEVLVHNATELENLLGGKGICASQGIACFAAVEGYTSWMVRGYLMMYPTTFIFIDSKAFLQNTYWLDEWGVSKPFPRVIKGLGSGGAAIVMYGLVGGPPSGSVSITSQPGGPAAMLNVTGLLKGFPAMPQAVETPSAVIIDYHLLGSHSIKDLVNFMAKEGFAGVVLIKLYAISRNPAITTFLRQGGFRVLTLDEVAKAPQTQLLYLTSMDPSLSMEAGLITIALTAAAVILAAYASSGTSCRAIILCRLRGLGLKEVSKATLITWSIPTGIISMIGCLAGLLLGVRSAEEAVRQLPSALTINVDDEVIRIYPWLSPIHPAYDMMSIAVLATTTALMIFIPSYILMRCCRTR